MSEINTGGPAFPTSPKNHNAAEYGSGMTLRDYFAAKAMQSLMSMTEIQVAIGKKDIKIEVVANASYEFADAMLEARDKS